MVFSLASGHQEVLLCNPQRVGWLPSANPLSEDQRKDIVPFLGTLLPGLLQTKHTNWLTVEGHEDLLLRGQVDITISEQYRVGEYSDHFI